MLVTRHPHASLSAPRHHHTRDLADDRSHISTPLACAGVFSKPTTSSESATLTRRYQTYPFITSVRNFAISLTPYGKANCNLRGQPTIPSNVSRTLKQGNYPKQTKKPGSNIRIRSPIRVCLPLISGRRGLGPAHSPHFPLPSFPSQNLVAVPTLVSHFPN